MAMSVDGLVTGMSTTETVKQLMQVEALPQTALKNKVSAQSKVVAAYQSINTKFAALVSAAKALGSDDTWSSVKATSNSDAAVVSTQPGASAGSLTFKVAQLATAHSVTYTDPGKYVSSIDDMVLSGTTIKVPLSAGGTTDLSVPDGSLKSVVAAINNTPEAAFRATAVRIGPDQYTLQLTAKTTGDASVFPAPDEAGSFDGIDPGILGVGHITTQGRDAELLIGNDDPYTIKSATNTFADVLPGVTVTAAKQQAPGDPRVSVDLTANAQGIADKVQALVDGANAVLSEVAAQSKVKNGAVPAGPLVGDSAVRALGQKILSAVAAGIPLNGEQQSFSKMGLKLTDGGRLDFKADVFKTEYAKDPALAQSYFAAHTPQADIADINDPRVAHLPTDEAKQRAMEKANDPKFQPGWDTQGLGLARSLETIALTATEGIALPVDKVGTKRSGVLEGLIQRRNDSIRALNDQVSAWDIRLDMRKTMLQRQFSNLEVAMGKMQQQSSWLAGQLSSLPTS